jgi:lipopolysaccharide export system protein LptA
MEKLFTKSLTANALVATFLASSIFFLPTTSAIEPDFEQEIIIKSQRQAGDLKNKIASYLDDVTITQGTLKIMADIVQVYQGDNDNPKYVAKGQPAIFEQTLADGNKIVLQANEIIYQPTSHMLTISGNALLQQAGSEVRGSKITYNTLTEQLEAESKHNETVTTILKPPPKKKGEQ